MREEKINTLLEQRARVLLTINKIQKDNAGSEDKQNKKKQYDEKQTQKLRKKALSQTISMMDILAEKNKAFAIASRALSFSKAVINSFEAYTKALADSANPVWAKIVLGLSLANAAMIAAQPLAEGGIVTRPTHALIGEAGPEAIIPLEKAGNVIGDTNITVIVEGGIASEGRQVEEVAEELGFLIDSELRKGRGF